MILTSAASLWLAALFIVISGFAEANHGCNHDSCLRAFIRKDGQAKQLCSSLTAGSVPSPLPTFASPCNGNKVSRMKSACACLNTASASSTTNSPPVTTSSTLTSSTTSSSTTSSLTSTSSIPPLPSCAPVITLSGASENAFNPANQPFQLLLSCSSLDTSNYTVYANWQPIITTNSSTSINIPGQPAGYTLLTVLGLDTTGTPLLQSFQLLFGTSTMQVLVLDAGGQPVAGATVQVNATTYLNIGQTATTDAAGHVTLINIPATTIGLKATTADNQIGVDGLAGGSQSSVTLQLVPLLPPVSGTPGFDVDNGTSGWTGGTLQTISKRDSHPNKRDLGLIVFTNYSPDVQTAYKSFNLLSKATSLFLVYKFQTDEFPGGYFGTEFNDYYSVTIRTDDGQSTSVFHSMNELGSGAFDANGNTQWYTVQMDVSKAATIVEFNVAVSNVADALYQSQVVVQRVGVCDKCATCTDCPDLAKCQDICINPPMNSCAFYQTCAEETLGCGSDGFPLAYGLQTCNKFQNSIDQFSSAGKTWFLNTEQCLQQALVPLLSCDGSCDVLQSTGFDSIPDCYNANNFCSLKGMDYVLILTTLKDDLYRNSLKAAVSQQNGCPKQIVNAIIADIQQKISDAAAGTNVLKNLADAHSLAIAKVFYQQLNSNGALPDIDTAVKYIKQVYDTAAVYPFNFGQTNTFAMDYLRYRKYNDLNWILTIGTIPPAWVFFAGFEGLEFYDSYPDPGSPPLALDLDHLYATMEAVSIHGQSTLGDSSGWLGDLYTFYGDWQRANKTSPITGSAFCQQNLGQQTKSTFPMEDLRQDADGYNTGMRLKANPSLSVADEFKNTMQGGGYAHRFQDFFQGRFGGSTATASALCMGYMTATDLETRYIRYKLTQRFGTVTAPEDIPSPALKNFCDGFAGVLQSFAASG